MAASVGDSLFAALSLSPSAVEALRKTAGLSTAPAPSPSPVEDTARQKEDKEKRRFNNQCPPANQPAVDSKQFLTQLLCDSPDFHSSPAYTHIIHTHNHTHTQTHAPLLQPTDTNCFNAPTPLRVRALVMNAPPPAGATHSTLSCCSSRS